MFPELVNLESNEIHRVFMDFVDRVVVLQGNATVNKFSLKCQNGVDSVCVSRWISNVLERGVLDLDLRVNVSWEDSMPGNLFVSKSLVRLRIETGNGGGIDVEEDVFLPKLKSLYLHSVFLGNSDIPESGNCFIKLVSGCHVLEELVMIDLCWNGYWNRYVSSKTLKRLTLCLEDHDSNPDVVSFDTPNLVYFEYSDHVADKYEKVSLDSVVEANIGLRMTRGQRAHARHGGMVGNATDLLMGLRNVQNLSLSANTIEVLTSCCEPIPVFKNLIHLTIKTHWDVGWKSLPTLLKNSPNLETLVFDGLHHKDTMRCEEVDGCLCKSTEDVPSCLASSPVKVVKILKFGEIGFYYDDKEKQMELVKYFLEIMPNLEQMLIYYNVGIDEGVKSQLQKLVPTSKCSVQLICDHTIIPTYPYSGIY